MASIQAPIAELEKRLNVKFDPKILIDQTEDLKTHMKWKAKYEKAKQVEAEAKAL